MYKTFQLHKGDMSDNGQITIVDEDRLCYVVKSESRGATGLRTISKKLLDEFVNYLADYPDATPNALRGALSGTSEIDKYEYGYAYTLYIMAKMVLGQEGIVRTSKNEKQLSLQQIYYGAPGTGKSNTIKREVDDKGKACVRTTFHPDSDYSTFVGCYKPTTKRVPMYTTYGEKAVPVRDSKGELMLEDRIVYEYVGQAFFQAYVEAWKNYAAAENEETPKEQYLVIEEINRGNCAQIFGDLFQLLDRNDSGFSDYPIKADTDLKKQLAKAFNGLEIDQKDKINTLYKNNATDVVAGVLSGDILLLPNNLYIWATMNTSDQSLFPIDSAFKRRWDWKYIPIKEHTDKNYKIVIGEKTYDWWGFLERINKVIGETTSSEDKKLGYFFVKTETSKVSDEQFVGKVLFYIWNDVFKNYGFDHTIFSKGEKDKFVFSDFFNADGTPNKDNVQMFLKRLEETIKTDLSLDITPKEESTTASEDATVPVSEA